MDTTINYIISFLLGEENGELIQYVEYDKQKPLAKITIKPSGFFGKDMYLSPSSIPSLPLKEISGIPILFGEPRIEKTDRTIIIHADLVASTFFLVSRYEECVNTQDRDGHGRFLGRDSILYKAGYIMRPLVDEYREFLLDLLEKMGAPVCKRKSCFSKVYLTHDVDQIWNWRNLYHAMRTFAKRTLITRQDQLESLKAWKNYEKYDKIYTFPWLVKMDNQLRYKLGNKKVESVYFLMGSKQGEYDFGYISKKKRVKKLADFLVSNGAALGVHASYAAGETPSQIAEEKSRIEKITGYKIKYNRNHYLDSREPEDMQQLVKNHISDDFTLGYADMVGFRLGTTRPVRWIDPLNLKVTDLVLHPLSIMECTLDGYKYMNLDEEKAYSVSCEMVDVVYRYAGELVLLWHNTTVAENAGNYQRDLYTKILQYVEKKAD